MKIPLAKNSSLCELHFYEKDIIRCDRKINNRGKTITNPNKQSALRKKNVIVDATPRVTLDNHQTELPESIYISNHQIELPKSIDIDVRVDDTSASGIVSDARPILPLNNNRIELPRSIDIDVRVDDTSTSEIVVEKQIQDKQTTECNLINFDLSHNTYSEVMAVEEIVETKKNNFGIIKTIFF